MNKRFIQKINQPTIVNEHQHNTVPVVLIRHAQSQWNQENRFTGWADPPLTAAGLAEAKQAGELLLAAGLLFDTAYSSRLQRAEQDTGGCSGGSSAGLALATRL